MQSACTGVYIQMRYSHFYRIVEKLNQIVLGGCITHPKKAKAFGGKPAAGKKSIFVE